MCQNKLYWCILPICLATMEKLNSLTLLIPWSNEKRIGFEYLMDNDTVEKFTEKFKDTWTKSDLNRNVSEALQLIPRHINTKIMHNLEVFAAKVCNKKTLKGNNPSELIWDI